MRHQRIYPEGISEVILRKSSPWAWALTVCIGHAEAEAAEAEAADAIEAAQDAEAVAEAVAEAAVCRGALAASARLGKSWP
jgi:hypothetical protein